VLEHNPDIRAVISVAQRARFGERLADARRIWRRYDLACAAMSSDRASFYSWFAGRKRIGLVEPAGKSWFKHLLFNRLAVDRPAQWHTVQSGLSLLPLLDIAPCPQVVAPGVDATGSRRLDALLAPAAGQPLAVLHAYPMYTYKMWHEEGWLALIAWLRAHGYAIALTGGPAPAEVAYVQGLAARAGGAAIELAGQLSLGETAETIRRACSSAPTPASRTWPPTPEPPPSRCSGRPSRYAGGPGRKAGARPRARGPGSARHATTMSICCRAPAPACLARWKAAKRISVAGAIAC
jgi:heptosyltransferase-3